MSQPTTNLVSTPAPANLNPGLSESYISALQGAIPGAMNTLNAAASGALPTQTSPALTSMEQALQAQQSAGAANLREQFGSQGLANSSNLGQAAASYETQSSTQMADVLAQYQLAQQQQQVGAAGTELGLTSTPATTTYAPDALVTGPSILSQIMGGASATGSLLTGLAGAAATGMFA